MVWPYCWGMVVVVSCCGCCVVNKLPITLLGLLVLSSCWLEQSDMGTWFCRTGVLCRTDSSTHWFTQCSH